MYTGLCHCFCGSKCLSSSAASDRHFDLNHVAGAPLGSLRSIRGYCVAWVGDKCCIDDFVATGFSALRTWVSLKFSERLLGHRRQL